MLYRLSLSWKKILFVANQSIQGATIRTYIFANPNKEDFNVDDDPAAQPPAETKIQRLTNINKLR